MGPIDTILLALLLGLAHLISEKICFASSSFRHQLISFSGGISLAYIFLDLLPRFSRSVSPFSDASYFSILLGFSSLHVIERLIYKRDIGSKRREDLFIEDSMVLILYYASIGALLSEFSSQIGIILLFIPIFLSTAFRTILPVVHTSHKLLRLLIAIAPVLGAIIEITVGISNVIVVHLIGFLIGAFLFTIARHSLPSGKKGSPEFFISGIVFFSVLLIALSSL